MNMRQEILKVLNRPVAHRGLHNSKNGIIENSSSAFAAAISKNYAIECDLQLSKDGVPMVFHDETLDRITDKSGKIYDFNAKELRKIPLSNSKNNDKILQFTELLTQIDGRVVLAVELKPQGNKERNELLAKKAVAAIKNYSGAIAFISFVPEILQYCKKFGFNGPIGIIVAKFDSKAAKEKIPPLKRFILRNMLHYPITRFDFLDVDHKALDLLSVRIFRKFGFPIACWTVTSQQEADEALKYCDQIAFENFIPK